MKPDPKMMLGAGFGLPEVQDMLLMELRSVETAKAVWLLPDVSPIARKSASRPSSGLVEYYRLLTKSRHA